MPGEAAPPSLETLRRIYASLLARAKRVQAEVQSLQFGRAWLPAEGAFERIAAAKDIEPGDAQWLVLCPSGVRSPLVRLVQTAPSKAPALEITPFLGQGDALDILAHASPRLLLLRGMPGLAGDSFAAVAELAKDHKTGKELAQRPLLPPVGLLGLERAALSDFYTRQILDGIFALRQIRTSMEYAMHALDRPPAPEELQLEVEPEFESGLRYLRALCTLEGLPPAAEHFCGPSSSKNSSEKINRLPVLPSAELLLHALSLETEIL